MRIAILHSGFDFNARSAQLEAVGARCLQFGDEVFLFGPNNRWGEITKGARSAGAPFEELEARPKLARLHLVAQKGRVFQMEHPDVPVLFDKGRYLVVDIEPTKARKLLSEAPCFTIRPLGKSETIFTKRDLSEMRGRTAQSAQIDGIVAKLDQAQFSADLQWLVSLRTRLSFTDGYREAVSWAANELSQLGYVVTVENVAMPGGRVSQNVFADQPVQSGDARLQVLIFGHLDSINSETSNVDSVAPGADDNGSGSAGVIAMARALAGQHGDHDLRFILFGGEEQGLFGSRQYVAENAVDLSRIDMAINMDMIGSVNTASPTVLLEGGAVSQTSIVALAEAAATYTQLDVQTSLNFQASDHVPFIEAGVPAVLTIEGADGANDRIHTAHDTIDHIDVGLAMEIIKMNTAAVSQHIGLSQDRYDGTASSACAGAGLSESRTTFQFSGRYSRGNAGSRKNRARAAPDTIHNLSGPLYLDVVAPELIDLPSSGFALRNASDVALALHVDIDGPAPLDVVSGLITIAGVSSGTDGARSHFIGKVTSQTTGAAGPKLVVENFLTKWPASGEDINRLDIDLSGSVTRTPEADVVFTTTGGQKHGPFTTRQISQSFRTVELEVDTETGARFPEPFDTHTHPDRPSDLPREDLTLESTFARAGIEIVRSSNPNKIASTAAGADQRWTDQEMHDAMEVHWSRFANVPQFASWIFLARHHEDSGLGGIMFDADIFDVGGVDRQGTAVFTENEFFHQSTGTYNQDNPPAEESATRELFFNLIHETGHAFNLFHSFQKNSGQPWAAPSWMPIQQDPLSMSWMNYPDSAAQSATGSFTSSAKWFYDRFRFEFDQNELLFLRHAPAEFVRMGDNAWSVSHGRIAQAEHNRKLQFELRVRKRNFELGEPVMIELKLANLSDKPIEVCEHLDLCDGFVQIAITAPDGTRIPFIPFAHARARVATRRLEPAEAMYEALPLVVGKMGLPFKSPGAYRIEASYRGAGGAAASVCQIYVAPPAEHTMLPVVNDLFDARIGRVLTMKGSREMDQELDKLDHIIDKLPKQHPLSLSLRPARVGAFSKNYKTFDINSSRVVLNERDPDLVVKELEPMVDNMGEAADAIGHIGFGTVMDKFVTCAVDVGKRSAASKAQKKLVSLFRKRGVVQRAIDEAEQRLKELS